MDHSLHLLLLLLLISSISAHAQSPTSTPAFQPALAVIVSVLSIVFSITFVLLAYARYCRHRPPTDQLDPYHLPTVAGILSSRVSRFSGIDKTVVESLPFFSFSSLRGSRKGLECAVCLSMFEDVELLRLLPKCKHAFHIDCIDEWLAFHSTCPLCRQAVTTGDLESAFTDNGTCSASIIGGGSSSSSSQSDRGENNNQLPSLNNNVVDLFVEREEEEEESGGIIGSSFRRIFEIGQKIKEDEAPIRHHEQQQQQHRKRVRGLHRLNHRILVSGFVFKNRWSNVSSSDLVFLNTELMMINAAAISSRSSSRLDEQRDIVKEEMQQRKRMVEQKESIELAGTGGDGDLELGRERKMEYCAGDKRSMSEITVYSRFFKEFGVGVNMKNGNIGYLKGGGIIRGSGGAEEMGRIWLPIAQKTVEWYAKNREQTGRSR